MVLMEAGGCPTSLFTCAEDVVCQSRRKRRSTELPSPVQPKSAMGGDMVHGLPSQLLEWDAHIGQRTASVIAYHDWWGANHEGLI
jgi:hypothetical protein